MASPCFQLEATRGPHEGLMHCHCSTFDAPSVLAESLSIGRKKRCWLQLPKDLEVSSVHAEFRSVTDQDNATTLVICDTRSTNGTKLNGKLLLAQQAYPLSDGDLIAVGRTRLRFMKVEHGLQCEKKDKERTAQTAPSSILTSCLPSLPVVKRTAEPIVIVLDDESGAETSDDVSAGNMKQTLADQPDHEPALDTEKVTNPMKNVVIIGTDNSTDGDDVEKIVAQLSPKSVKNKLAEKIDNDPVDIEDMLPKPVTSESTDESKKEEKDLEVGRTPLMVNSSAAITEVVEECEATCTKCNEAIGQLDVLRQQEHFNECIGGRVATVQTKASKPKTRKRGNAGSGVPRAKKCPRKPMSDQHVNDSLASVTKTRRPRKGKKADSGEDIVLALALNDMSKMDPEQQTDLQLAAAKQKLEQLDEQMAKLTKQRGNLVKKLNRLEKAKEKLRKSQVLLPAKARELLDFKAALDAVFPSDREAFPKGRRSVKEQTDDTSVIARYAPSTRKTSVSPTDDEAKVAAVAAISMWSRASQQMFGLPSESLLYRNSILQSFEDPEDGGSGCIIKRDDGQAEKEGKDPTVACELSNETCGVASAPSDCTVEEKPCDPDVPDYVKRVFPNWARDLAFLKDQSPDAIEVALKVMNDAQSNLVAVTSCTEGEQPQEQIDAAWNREDQRRACDFMGHVMMRLITEKR
ncbi:hypothetical protein PsorP6_006090 [Peronosclerospora sorghi]|uniref:Uncharacterized protein n=1 Tax=Peronosclerospora sorghi TaxID=230839 RepID=A0ACC0W254_9STRA|nr:hypothetical protein PsorP6_006090 [Peronosclerospora sorghi]